MYWEVLGVSTLSWRKHSVTAMERQDEEGRSLYFSLRGHHEVAHLLLLWG
jgi:hypothetical protein